MGLLSSIFGGGSRASTTSTSTTSVDSQSLGLSNIKGPAIAGNRGNVTVMQTDQGAIRAAANIAGDAIRANELAAQGALDLSGSIANDAFDTSARSFDFAARALAETDKLASDAVASLAETQAGALAKVINSGRADAAVLVDKVTRTMALTATAIAVAWFASRVWGRAA